MFFTSQHVEGTLFLLLFDLRFLFPPCCSAINRPVPSLSPSPPLDRWSEIRQIHYRGSIHKCFRRNLESRCYNKKFSRAIGKPLEQNGEQRKPATSFFDRTKDYFFLTNVSFFQMPEVEEIPFALFFFFETDDRPTPLSTCPCLKDNPFGREEEGGGKGDSVSMGKERVGVRRGGEREEGVN